MISGLQRPKTAECKSLSIMGMGTIHMGTGMGMVVGTAMGTVPTMGMVGMGTVVGTGMAGTIMAMVGMGMVATTIIIESQGFALAARSM
jgi:hypothetical protein